ncbi:MAG: hypothetical protein IKF72_08865 [Kiritimatiellae bacterium]|nr:hypothetical protein [Kiritimatiellia bacterium]
MRTVCKVILAAVAAVVGMATAHATSTTIASTNLNGVLVVERGDSFEVTGNMSIATTAGATGKVENYGTMNVKELDLGKYSASKGALAQVDNYGTLTIGTHLRMGIVGTPSIFYNHEGGTVNKTGGGGYNFYLGANAAGTVSTLISEGNFTFPSGDQLRAGANSGTTNHIVLAKSGTFTANGHIYMSEANNTLGTLVMKDNSRLTGSGNIVAPARVNQNSRGPNSLAYIILSNDAAIVKTKGYIHLGANTNSFGCLSLNDNSRVDLPNVLYVGAMGLGAGRVELHDNASLKAGTYLYVGGSASSTTGELVAADSAHVTNDVFCVGCYSNGLGTATFGGQSHLECTSNGYIAHGNDEDYTSTGHMTFDDSSTAVFNNYLQISSGRQGKGSLMIKDNASVSVLHRELLVGASRDTTASLTVADNARLLVSKIDPAEAATNLLAIASKWLSSGQVTVTNSGYVLAPSITVAEGSSSKGTFNVAGGCVVSSNITVSTGSSSAGEFVVADGGVVSNVFNIQIGAAYDANTAAGKGGLLRMRGGTMLFNIGYSKNSAVIYLNPLRDKTAGAISGWGKLAFTDPIAMVRDMNSENPGDYEKPGGITHYGLIIADGEGQMRDLDFSRLGVLTYDTTDANLNGSTNGWYAVNKGRLKLPRSLPRKSASHRCVGDYWKVSPSKARRLMNTFNYTLEGAETNNYMFAELYATDRDDIPAGLDEIDADKTLAVWRVGHFSDGPEIDEPTHPAAFTSATIRFRYCPTGAEGLKYVYVFRHDGTANGKWHKVGYRELSVDNPIIDTRSLAPCSENWNFGWFAVLACEERLGGMIITVL